jgi:hypothetical protein
MNPSLWRRRRQVPVDRPGAALDAANKQKRAGAAEPVHRPASSSRSRIVLDAKSAGYPIGPSGVEDGGAGMQRRGGNAVVGSESCLGGASAGGRWGIEATERARRQVMCTIDYSGTLRINVAGSIFSVRALDLVRVNKACMHKQLILFCLSRGVHTATLNAFTFFSYYTILAC